MSEHPTYAGVDPGFAARIRSMPRARDLVVSLGAVRSVTYKGSGKGGTADIYEVTSENGYAEWLIALSPEGLVTTLFCRPIEKQPAVQLTAEQFDVELRAKLKEAVAADRFAGVVLIAKAGKPVFEAAYGPADRKQGIPNRLDTTFRIGSMNKMFTAVAVLQLFEAGKLGLDDVVGKHLTNYPNAEIAGNVTIRHLLMHTGGTGDIFGPLFLERFKRLRTLEDYVELYGTRGPAFQPGSRFEYSNYGYILLGLIVAKASGQSYFNYVREKVFRPAGMTATDAEAENGAAPGRSIGYTDGAQGLKPNTDMLPPRATSSGPGYSAAGDLLRFANALQSHRLLLEKNTALLTAGVVKARDGKWALGFFDHVDGSVRWFGHGGSGPGMNGELRIFPASGHVVVVLANLDSPAAMLISDFITARLPK